MDTQLFKSYQQSITNYQKAKSLLDKAEQQKQDRFNVICNYLMPLVKKELQTKDNVSDYYLNGEGRIVVTSFALHTDYIEVQYGYLAEDDIFPHSIQTMKLFLFSF